MIRVGSLLVSNPPLLKHSWHWACSSEDLDQLRETKFFAVMYGLFVNVRSEIKANSERRIEKFYT
jgi:hypothetical protein